MISRRPSIVAVVALAGAIGMGIPITDVALAQTTTTTSTGSAAPLTDAPPTTGSQQGVNPPNATPGETSVSAAPGSVQPDRVPTGNPAADRKTTTRIQ